MVKSVGTARVTVDEEAVRARIRELIKAETVPCPECGYHPSDDRDD